MFFIVHTSLSKKKSMLGSALNATIASNRGLNRNNPCPYRKIYRNTSHLVLINLEKCIQTGSCRIVDPYLDDRSHTYLADQPVIS